MVTALRASSSGSPKATATPASQGSRLAWRAPEPPEMANRPGERSKQEDLADFALVGAGQRWWAMLQVVLQL